ncbi:anoctamin-4-like isoform X2 [Amphiura filiformis]|uniref:anoctamin-4-like isoform X2 n=1 Tax=Amphiura filiformis TaxID=82378 RepID=UPI003B22098E
MSEYYQENGNGHYVPLTVRQLPALRTNGDITPRDLTPREGEDPPSYLYKPKKRSKKKKKKKKKDKMEEEEKSAQQLQRRIDYVLSFKKEDSDYDSDDEKEFEQKKKKKMLRKKFHSAIKGERLQVREEELGENVFLLIHAPFARLCEEAEDIKLEMPLKGAEIKKGEITGCCAGIERRLITDNEVDYVSAPFMMHKRSIYKGIDESTTFFSPSLRSYLVHSILLNIDVKDSEESADVKDGDSLRKQGLPFMLMKKAFTEAFILHEESPYEYMEEEEVEQLRAESVQRGDFDPKQDPREEMQRTWCRWFKYQPLWKIRNYFGEKISFYFAWAGCLASMLWVPMLLGLAIWGYGLFLSSVEYKDRKTEQETAEREHQELIDEIEENITLYNRTEDKDLLANITSPEYTDSFVTSLADFGLEMLRVFQDSFDSDVTPYFALVICLWGTIFQELWKRKAAKLAYEWDVDDYEDTEPDRPEFYGTKERPDPVNDLPDWYYPFYRQFLKFATSFSILIFMVMLVIASALGVIVYRVIVGLLLQNSSSVEQILFTSLASSLLNTFSIMIFGKIYEYIAYKLTDWENHRTQSAYENALIIKLFAFQFVNSYSSLFYIAFFRSLTTEQGIFNLGPDYADGCGDTGNCMSMLSLQVFTLMIFKPFPKFFKDIILPWIKKQIRKCRKGNKIVDEAMSKKDRYYFLLKEHQKPPVGNFTLAEYTEKIIMYGFLMLFSCANPVAPLIALLVLLIDIRIDAGRLLWFNQRPVSLIAGNIGMWFTILDFLNFAGVVTNSFLIAFTAEWGRTKPLTQKLWIIIGFEHIVFAVKIFIAAVIPDVPKEIMLASRRERYQVSQAIDNAENQEPLSY